MKSTRTVLMSCAAALAATILHAPPAFAQQATEDHSAHHAAPAAPAKPDAPKADASKPATPPAAAAAPDMSKMMADMAKMMEGMKSSQGPEGRNRGGRNNRNGNQQAPDDMMARMSQMMTMMSRAMSAQQTAGGGHDMASMQAKGDQGPSSQAFAAINRQMHAGMDISFSGNADVDFVKGMIPHHAGAVDMAKVVLAFGKDPEIRKLAEGVVKAQEAEIAMMKEWLAKNAK